MGSASMSKQDADRRCVACDTLIVAEHEEDEDGFEYCSLDCLEWMDEEVAIERWRGWRT